MRGTVGLSARLVLLLTVLAVVAAACGASDAEETATTSAVGQATDQTTDETAATAPDSDDALEFVTIPLPDGLRPWWESTSRTQAFAESNFLLAASSDVAVRGENPGITVLQLDAALEWVDVDVTIPPPVTSADMHMSGSQLVISYLDPVGEIVVLSTEDGTAFAETRLALPKRYVAANEWTHTTLIGNLAGAADLNESVFTVANTGIIWERPIEIAERYAVEQEQDPEVAESIRYANTIRTNPTGDGDSLFVFEKSGKVVAEVLGSDAGIEAGYSDAFSDRDDDTFEMQSWTIDGSTSTNLDAAPFNGEEGLRVHALYPVDGGVAAMVTDFNFAERAEEASSHGPAFAERGIATPNPTAIRAGESEWRLRTMVTLDGLLWFLEAALGVPNPSFGSLAWGTYEGVPLFVLVFFADGGAGMAASADGSTWSAVEHVLGIDAEHGDEVHASVIGKDTTDVWGPDTRFYTRLDVAFGSDGSATIEVVVAEKVGELSNYELAVLDASLGEPADHPEGIARVIGDLLVPSVPQND